ncbi:MAG: TolC family protein [Sediminibacterium magnilacihabitans]|jgi:outer membrane protein TolC|nr:TolC family protein [Sediminibacterium magnilacihabitans]PQV61559.1 outer membrane protein TolC [Sediminibacterium magnilacihabitans]
MNKKHFIIVLLFAASITNAQTLSLNSVLDSIQKANPSLKMYDADIRSMDEAAKGARSWMPPEFGAGFYMTPYNPSMWKAGMKDGNGMQQPGMGSFMLSAQQMFPNKQRQNAEANYMQAMSSVEKERKKASLNDLYAEAKKNYYQWIVLEKKLTVIEQNEKLLNFMIKNAEIRYKNGMEKLSAYYKAKASLGNLQNMRLMLQAEIVNKRIALNTLMNRNKGENFAIDTTYTIKNYGATFDSSTLAASRSDIRAIERNITLTYLQQNVERAKLKPEFGIKYDHMFAWAKQPWQFSLMGMVRIPIGASTRMQKANIESLKWKAVSLSQQRQMMLNEASGMAYSMSNEINLKQNQLRLYEENIIPSLQNNYKTMQLGYEQNTEELFMLFDAWESLNMIQLEYLDKLQELLTMQAELERILEIK